MQQTARLGLAWGTVALFLMFGDSWLAGPIASTAALVLLLWLFVTMGWAAFGAIGLSDKLAELLGEPLGSLFLTLTIICLEGVLIGIAMLTSDAGATIGRDTLFSANMIMINFAGGLALFLGGLRHREQTHNFQGTSAFLAIVMLLSVFGFILPNFTEAVPHGSLTTIQAIGITIVTLGIYLTFLLIQIGRHRHFFAEPDTSDGLTPQPPSTKPASTPAAAKPKPADGRMGKLSLLLVAHIVPVLLLGKYLMILLDDTSAKLGTPPALSGIILALIVVSPKMISAIKAGMDNQPQRAVNLALGSCAPAMGIIIPIILGIGVVTGNTIILGAAPSDVVLLALTLGLSVVTFYGRHTTLLEGAAHLTVFFIYILLMFSP